jgi:luciferase family oxidoreductase group 1
MSIPLSLLDLAPIGHDETPAEALTNAVELATTAERTGYSRVWYAEHHNQASVASAATSVVIGHVVGRTSTIRVGSGGVMLPNHSPLTIAEQFGTLATLYPDRIDLGIGRAPGGDANTQYALRRDRDAGERFEQDVRELRGFLTDSIVPGVLAVPGYGTEVPLTILGSSLYGASLAARLGLPFAFAAHFSPAALDEAVSLYRREFEPSRGNEHSHLMISAIVIAADDHDTALEQRRGMLRIESSKLLSRGAGSPRHSDAELDAFLGSSQGEQFAGMFEHSAIGTTEEVHFTLRRLAERTGADELLLAHQAPRAPDRIRSIELVGGPDTLAITNS